MDSLPHPSRGQANRSKAIQRARLQPAIYQSSKPRSPCAHRGGACGVVSRDIGSQVSRKSGPRRRLLLLLRRRRLCVPALSSSAAAVSAASWSLRAALENKDTNGPDFRRAVAAARTATAAPPISVGATHRSVGKWDISERLGLLGHVGLPRRYFRKIRSRSTVAGPTWRIHPLKIEQKAKRQNDRTQKVYINS